MLPFISVILPVRNERAMLPRLIEELLRQNYPADRFEILVVDGRSSDGTADLVRRRFANKPVHVLDNPGIHSSSGRNIGIRAAVGDVLIFIDGHCAIPSRNLLEDTAAIMTQSGAGCLCRPQPLLAPSETHTGEAISNILDGQAQSMKDRGFADPVNGGATYRRDVFNEIGLFDETFNACEEIDFNIRIREAGILAYTDPRLAVYYQPRKNVSSLFRQMVRAGRARVQLMRRHAGTFSRAEFAPIAALAMMAMCPVAWALLPAADAELLSIPLALLVVAVLVASIRQGILHGPASIWRAPGIYAGMYCGLGAGELIELLTQRGPTASIPALDQMEQLEEVEEVERAA